MPSWRQAHHASDYIDPDVTYRNFRSNSITLPSTLKAIKRCAFSCNTMKYIDLPESLKELDCFCFGGCDNLKSIVIPDSVTTIPDSMVWNCESLRAAVFGKSVTKLQNSIFGDYKHLCRNLKELFVLSANPPELDDTYEGYTPKPFTGMNSATTVYVPKESLSLYEPRPEEDRDFWSNERYASSWSFFYDFRPLPDVFAMFEEPQRIVIIEGEQHEISYKLMNLTSTADYRIEWESDNEEIATVEEGVVTAIKPGDANIYIKITSPSGEYVSQPCYVRVWGGPGSGIEEISEEVPESLRDLPDGIYDVNGIRVNREEKDLLPGLYIIIDDNTPRKVLVK